MRVVTFFIVFTIIFIYGYVEFPNLPIIIHFTFACLLGGCACFDRRVNRNRANLDISNYNDTLLLEQRREEMRLEALNNVKLFLSPFKDIWNNLRISNKYCSLKLTTRKTKMIIGTEKVDESVQYYKTFEITDSRVYSIDKAWELFCNTYDNNTTYKRLTEICKSFHINYSETTLKNPAFKKHFIKEKKEKVDINNCSEIEMTALPAISIVLSKRAIKRREEIGGFKSIEEFFEYLKIKPRIREQLKDEICVNKMRGQTQIVLNSERTLDL